MFKPIVNVKEGRVRGTTVKSVLGPSYIVFHEIPFANPPVGKLRFKDPEPPSPWMGILDCSVSSKKYCTQMEDTPPYYVYGNEDCLYLNVYTNSLNQRKPVMFWIHGGRFMTGTGSYRFMRPDYLIAKDVVIVTTNYRLGVFGFLNLGHRAAPGNQGLKDLIAALQWIKENISKFGGDPNNVTVFGQSAGSVLTHALLLSPSARGLFQKAILQSGNLTCPWGFGQSRSEYGFKLAELLGITSTDPEEIVESLRMLPDKSIAQAQCNIIQNQEWYICFDIPFGLNIDDVADNPVLPQSIEQLCLNESNIPIMIGTLPYETLMFLNDNLAEVVKSYNLYLHEYVKILGNMKGYSHAEVNELFQMVKERYLNGQPISIEKIDEFLYLMTDIYFSIPIKLYAEDRVKRTSMPIYYYLFSYVGEEKTFTDLLQKRIFKGASHMDDLTYLFYMPLCKLGQPDPPAYGTKDRLIMERLTTMWTNFARTGNPTPHHDDFVETTWISMTKDQFNYLKIDETSEMLTMEPHLFVETGSVEDPKKSPSPPTVRSSENVAAVAESATETPGTSIRHHSQELNISRTNLQSILTKDLHLHAYKIQLCQELKPLNHL
ncbi:esterase E4-like [Ptiloglossa arizonensis]|uniref:esterase E4-like n=1 Tax=Ptiloglossa arizonensis TaxID=3350558 RepID=UPI003F9F40E6